MMKKIALAVLGVLLLFVMSACSSVSTPPDGQALHYKGGEFSSQTFESCVEPSTREFNGPGDAHYTYPAGQRTFSFTGRKGTESDAISVKTKDSQEMNVKGFVTFTLTSDCDLLRKFHEKVGNKYTAYEDEGWRKFLGDYMGVPLNSTMDKAGLNYDWRTLYSSNEALSDFESRVESNLPTEVKNALGEDFIKINKISLETPQPSKELRTDLEAKESAKLQNDAQKEKNATARTKFDSFADCKKVMSEAACIQLTAIEKGVPVYIIPSGTGVNLGSATK